MGPFVDERLGCYLEIYSKINGLCHAEGIFLGSKTELIRLLKPLLHAGTPTEADIKTLYYPDAIDFLDPDEPIPGRNDQSVKFSSAWGHDFWSDEPISIMRKFLEDATGTEANFFFINWGGAISRVPKDETAFFGAIHYFIRNGRLVGKINHKKIQILHQLKECVS